MNTQKAATVFLSLGSNLGNRMKSLQNAREALPPFVTIQKISTVYETPPWGYTEQPPYLNQVIFGKTDLLPLELLKAIKEIETRLGRKKTFRFGPRSVDIDILLYDELILVTSSLVIPHPRMLQRGFVLVPLAEIAPNLIIPGTPRTVREHMQKVAVEGIPPVQGVSA